MFSKGYWSNLDCFWRDGVVGFGNCTDVT